jgi:23S rRNA pseudouridine1911/1915/1917 synthase
MARLDILHVSNHVLCVVKPACVPTVPDDSGDTSMVDLAKAWIREEFGKPGAVFLGVVHRLDRPVSGVVCFGRTSKGAARLSESFRGAAAKKTYVAVTSRPLRESEGVIEHWLLKDTSRNTVRVVEPDTPGAKRAETRFQRLESRGGESLVRLSPITGRSHQLRVAMASLGAPLKGDLRYGATSPLPDRSVALHALSLEVPHPTRPEPVALRAALPPQEVWRGWREL